ncbi:MAG: addiction module antitoxin RelB [Elusimicrobia bacterium]|nr:MAG: addiction module antitoxin RelB [Elusimicrobiota bacterium]
MSSGLFYHPSVVSDDIPRIDKNLRKRLANAIELRLSAQPESYGKPLRGTLAGFWRLRVGDYRIIFRIVKREVWILGIINRKDVYDDIVKRLEWKT